MRDTIIFSGASNTFGLGLEIELRDKYNDDAWLKENGMFLPNPREKEDIPFWKEHRWTKLVSDGLGLIEYNIHDEFLDKSHPLGGNSIETLWYLNRDDEFTKNILDRTKFIVFEMGWIRWWDKDLHGSNNSDEYPNTILEIIDLINNPNSSQQIVAESIEWIKNLDEKLYWDECFKKYKNLKDSYPEIQFVLVPWVSMDISLVDASYKKDFVDVGKYYGMFQYLTSNKLTVGDFAKAFNGNYKFNYKDDHPSKLGHRHVANFVINHINKNNDLETIPFKK